MTKAKRYAKPIYVLVALVLALSLLVVAAPGVLAWQEGPSTDWWYINASYGDYHSTIPLVIEINGNPASGQVFNVGDIVTITGDLHAYAASCAGWANEAYTEWHLEVSGPSGSDSDNGWDYDYSNSCAESDVDTTLSITYTLTATGTHTVYMSSYAAVAQYYTDVADEYVDASLTFAVIEVILVDIDIKPGSDPNSINLGSQGVIPVAILSSADFDATEVNSATVELAGAGVAVRGKGNKSLAHEEDVNGDGLLDLVVQVETENLDPGMFQDGVVCLTGETFGGQPIKGCDEVVIVPPE